MERFLGSIIELKAAMISVLMSETSMPLPYGIIDMENSIILYVNNHINSD